MRPMSPIDLAHRLPSERRQGSGPERVDRQQRQHALDRVRRPAPRAAITPGWAVTSSVGAERRHDPPAHAEPDGEVAHSAATGRRSRRHRLAASAEHAPLGGANARRCGDGARTSVSGSDELQHDDRQRRRCRESRCPSPGRRPGAAGAGSTSTAGGWRTSQSTHEDDVDRPVLRSGTRGRSRRVTASAAAITTPRTAERRASVMTASLPPSPSSHRQQRGLGAVVHLQLPEDAGDVVLHRLLADEEALARSPGSTRRSRAASGSPPRAR